MTRIAVTAIMFELLPHLKDELLAQYPDVKFKTDREVMTEDWLIDFHQGCDAALIGIEKYTERVISSLPDLKVLSCCSVGVDHIDPAVLEKHGVRLGWTAGVNKTSVAELTISFMVNLLRKVNLYNVGLRAGDWPRIKMGLHLQGRTVGIHGCGHVGKEVVKRLQPFEVRVLACDRVDYADFYEQYGVTPVSPEELWAESEVLTIHLPKNQTTLGLYTEAVLDKLRPGCFLVNTARGNIVDETALKVRLMDNRIAGAAFDVFAEEPVTNRELVDLPNFLATPHIGGSAREAWEAVGRAGIKGLSENFEPKPGVYPFD